MHLKMGREKKSTTTDAATKRDMKEIQTRRAIYVYGLPIYLMMTMSLLSV